MKRVVINLSERDQKNLEFLMHYHGQDRDTTMTIVLDRAVFEIQTDLREGGFPETSTLKEVINLTNAKLDEMIARKEDHHVTD